MLSCAGSALTQSARGPTIAAIELLSLLKSLLSGHPFLRGTLCAFIGFAFIALYYRHARYKLGKAAKPPSDLVRLEFPGRQSWPELRSWQIGADLSVAVFVLAGAADMGKEWLEQLRGAILGFCGAIAVGILGFGFVCLMNLWKELISQLRRASVGSLLVSIPLVILWLAMGFGVLIGMGMVADRFAHYIGALLRPLLWLVITLLFWGLWRGRSRALLVLRLVLMFSFSAIILSPTVFICWWVFSETAPLLVFFLAVIASLNVLFYSRFVRDTALKDNLVDTRI